MFTHKNEGIAFGKQDVMLINDKNNALKHIIDSNCVFLRKKC
jgi:hypothetical protein